MGYPGALMETFEVDVRRFVAKAKERQEAALMAIAQDALARVKELTPVKTGNLRANWQIVAAGDEQEVLRLAATATVILEDAAPPPLQFKIGDVLLVMNPVVYARRIEFGFVGEDSLGRHYNQAGRGMMQQTLAEMPKIAREAVRRVIQEGTPT